MAAPEAVKKVVCLVFEQDNKILLEQRLDDDAYRGDWMFTGGKVEDIDRIDGRPIERAALREAREETGLTPQSLTIFTEFDQTLRDGRRFSFIGVHILKWIGQLENLEVARRNLAWIDIAKAANLIGNHEVDKKILEDFLNYQSEQ